MKRHHIDKKTPITNVNAIFKCPICIPPSKERAYTSKNALKKHLKKKH